MAANEYECDLSLCADEKKIHLVYAQLEKWPLQGLIAWYNTVLNQISICIPQTLSDEKKKRLGDKIAEIQARTENISQHPEIFNSDEANILAGWRLHLSKFANADLKAHKANLTAIISLVDFLGRVEVHMRSRFAHQNRSNQPLSGTPQKIKLASSSSDSASSTFSSSSSSFLPAPANKSSPDEKRPPSNLAFRKLS